MNNRHQPNSFSLQWIYSLSLRLRRQSAGDDGMTLMEVLIVVFVTGILATIAWPSWLNMQQKAYYAEARAYMDAMRDELEMYRLEAGDFPPDVNANTRPAGITGKWYLAADMPYNSGTDYEHWGVGSEECVVAITWFGRNQQRNSPAHTKSAGKSAFAEYEDDLVLTLNQYSCPGTKKGSKR
ncbi:MAG: type IV pilin protein [Thainema sp.]